MPPNKGTFFFSQHYRMGIDWYERFFVGAGALVAGEVSEDYLAAPEALFRIKEYDPAMRLICCLRNPYDRAISSWRFFARNGRDQPSLVAQAQRNPAVFDQGHYGTQLRVAHALFSDSQILIFLFEELASDPRSVARRLYQFIGVDPEFAPPSLYRRLNGSSRPRSRLLAGLVHDIHIRSWGASRTMSNAIGLLKRVRPIRRLVQMALYADGRQSPHWRDFLNEFPDDWITRYEQEISELERILARDLSSWHARGPTDEPSTDNAFRSSADSCRP